MFLNNQKKIDILFITGSYPPDPCGVGDYTYSLIKNIQLFYPDISIDILYNENWSFSNFFCLVSKIKIIAPKVIHIQYPTKGFEFSITPQILSLFFKCIVTLHEFSQAKFLRKISLFPFSIISSIIFTTKHEKRSFAFAYPWSKYLKTVIIPVGSSMISNNNTSSKEPNIVYFGLIQPNKGIEKVILLGKKISESNLPCKVIIMGKKVSKHNDYFESLKIQSLGLPIDWVIDKDGEYVNMILSKNKFGYLPFPDGASERRTSLLAMLSHGLVTITTKSHLTPSELDSCVFYVNEDNDVLELLNNLLKSPSLGMDRIIAQKEYLKKFNWQDIVQKHIEFYRSL